MKTLNIQMKKYIPIRYPILMFLLIVNLSLHGQNTGVEDNETLIGNNPEKQKINDMFEMDNKEYTNQLFKMNLFVLARLNPTFGYEHRIGKNFSTETYFKMQVFNYPGLYFVLNENYEFENKFMQKYHFEENLKYYYNYKRRIKKNKNISGFSANYISLFCFANFNDFFPDNYQNLLTNKFLYQEPDFAVGLKYGMHRRIGNFGYLDAFIGAHGYKTYIEITDNTISVTNQSTRKITVILGIRAGFALDSFKNLNLLF